MSRRKGMYLKSDSQSSLLTMTAPLGEASKRRKWVNISRMLAMFALISASVRSWRVSSRPDGSPTFVVPPPMRTMDRCPHSCKQCGHRSIVLMGGGTTKVGDPSGRDETRQLLTDAEINANIASIREIFTHFLRFDASPSGAVMVNNDDWLSDLRYIPFLRDIGRHFSINRMLTMDSVKLRLEREQPLTFLEFNYMILQGYDFVELNKRYQCTLQMGGSDQWGNILQGVELGRRVRDCELFGVTSALITTASGAKMGKTASGAVWLSRKRLSAYDYWQHWRNTEDGDVGRFL